MTPTGKPGQPKAQQTLRRTSDRQLERLLAAVADAMADTLQSLVDRPLTVHHGSAVLCRGETPGIGTVVVRGRLEREGEGHFIWFRFSAVQAVTIASLMMMSTDDVVLARRDAGRLGETESDAFTEVGNVLCSGVDSLLGDRLGGAIGVRFDGIETPGDGDPSSTESRPTIAYRFRLGVSSYPADETAIVVDVETADRIANVTGRLPTSDADDDTADASKAIDTADDSGGGTRGELDCFLSDPAVLEVVRRSCRAAGLRMQRHGVAEAPNPAAHKTGIVLLDVPLGQDRRFDWCRRLRQASADVRVILLVHYPSRERVLLGLMAKADVILGWPVEESVLAERLDSLLTTQT